VVAGVLAVVLTIAVLWLAADRHPPEWDYANHLEHAVLCWRDLAAGDVRGVFGHSSFYPPLVPCAAGLVFRLIPSDIAFGEVVILAFLGLGTAATYLLGRRFAGGPGGVVAATLFATAPFVVNQALRFQLDVPLASMVAMALATLAATDRLEGRKGAVAVGALLGLGMLTKPPFFVYVGPACVLVLAQARYWMVWQNAGLAGLVAALLALPWYGPRLVGLPFQIRNRSFKQAAESGFPEALSPASLAYYPANLPVQFGLVAALLLVLGLGVAIRRRQWFLLAGLAPFAVFLLLQNKQLRYTLPLLPAAAAVAGVGFSALPRAARTVAGVAIAAAAAIQLASTAFGVPSTVRLAGIPLTAPAPPSRAAWQQRDILDLIVRDGGAVQRTVSVAPNHPHFSPANFRYYATRDALPLRIARAWESDPIGIDYMILKTGDVGPPWTADKSRRVAQRVETDAELARVFPVIGEFALPDGSTATVRARRISAAPGITPQDLARVVDRALRVRLTDVTREVEGLAIRLDYDADILVGRLKRLEISATSIMVGELRRRQAAVLRLRDLRLAVDDVVFNPWSAVLVGRFDPLDARRLAVERATIDAADLRVFLGQVKGFGGTTVALGDGFADLRVEGPGPAVSARVRVVAASDRPFALIAERVSLGGVPVPSLLVNWVMRNVDPSPGIAARLPFPATMGPVIVTARSIRIGG
jgi:hypothetical protein